MRLNGRGLCPTFSAGHGNFPIHPKKNIEVSQLEKQQWLVFIKIADFFGSHTVKRCEHVRKCVPPHLADAIALESVRNY